MTTSSINSIITGPAKSHSKPQAGTNQGTEQKNPRKASHKLLFYIRQHHRRFAACLYFVNQVVKLIDIAKALHGFSS